MVFGLGLVFFEFQTGYVERQLGPTGRLVVLVCGTLLSVWGLKEMIACFWPKLSNRGYHFALPREGAAYLLIMIVLFVGALIGRSNTLMMVFAVLAGPFVMNGWYTYTMLRFLRVRRELPDRIMAGETFTTSLTLENRKSWLSAWVMTVRDSVAHQTGLLSPEVLFVRVPPASERRGHYQLRLRKRGRYRFGPVDVTTRFPIGFVQRGVFLNVSNELLVFPRKGRLCMDWRRQLQNSLELVADVRPQPGPFNDELYRIREFRPGDETRMIHWRTSARMQELMVCDYKESRDRDLILLLDPWLPARPTEDDSENVERLLRFAVTICMDQLRNSRESTLVVRLCGREMKEWRGDTGEAHLDDLLDAFALFEATSHSRCETLLSDADALHSGQGRVLIVSTRPQVCREVLSGSEESLLAGAHVLEATSQGLATIYEDVDSSSYRNRPRARVFSAMSNDDRD